MNKEEQEAKLKCSIVNNAYDGKACCLCNEDSHKCQYWRLYLIEFKISLIYKIKKLIKIV